MPYVEKWDHASGYRDSPVVSGGRQDNLTHGADPNIDNLPEAVDDDNDWNFDEQISEESVQRAGVKRKLLDLLEE